MLNFNQLRIFFHAAKSQNFTQAAKELFITQPAVSAQIKGLEEACNLVFFKKRGRRVYLTEEGKILFKHACKIFEYARELENIVNDLQQLKIGVLRLGTTKTYARYFMPFMISTFHEKHPDIKIQLNEGSSLEMTYSLLEFKNEVAVIAKAEDHPEVQFIPFSREEVIVIAPVNHPLAVKKSVSLQELAREPLIMKEAGSGTRKRVLELFAKAGQTPNILMETGNTEFIKQLVQRGDGVAFLVKEAVLTEVQEKKLAVLPIREKQLFLDVSVAYLKNQHLSPPARAFIQILDQIKPGDLTLKGIGSLMAKMLVNRNKNLNVS
ncbi:MAG: LysR family transcriptional regulator [Deltaproteobacteria bacterium]|nr:LysR family transcriptional regulator [Deltaproteobacteria bacterium]